MRFSVIVTVYNLGGFLYECLDSIKYASANHDVEVIVVNDGSDDIGTISVLACSKIKYGDFLFFDKKNGGPASARNLGISKSSGYYIIPFDADNIMRPDFFEKLNNKIEELNGLFDIIYFNALFFGNKNFVWPDKDYDLADLTVSNFIDACTCFSRILFDRLGGFDESDVLRGFEDWDFWLRATACNARFVFLREVLFDYRVRTGSMLDRAWPNRNQIFDYIFDKPQLVDLKIVRLSKLNDSSSKMDGYYLSRIKKIIYRIFIKRTFLFLVL
ncbi:MAG: glycosyltransferase family 2 protein [Arcticibacter sp.]